MGYKRDTVTTDASGTFLVELICEVSIDGEAVPVTVPWSDLKPVMPTFIRLTPKQFHSLKGAGRIHRGSMAANYDLGLGARRLTKNSKGRLMVVNAHGEPVFCSNRR